MSTSDIQYLNVCIFSSGTHRGDKLGTAWICEWPNFHLERRRSGTWHQKRPQQRRSISWSSQFWNSGKEEIHNSLFSCCGDEGSDFIFTLSVSLVSSCIRDKLRWFTQCSFSTAAPQSSLMSTKTPIDQSSTGNEQLAVERWREV